MPPRKSEVVVRTALRSDLRACARLGVRLAQGVFAGLGFRPTMLEMTIEASGVRRATPRRAAPSGRRG